MDFVARLVELSPRQLGNERKAARVIEHMLTERGIKFHEQLFTIQFPKWTASRVVADGKRIPSRPSGLVSGTIKGVDSLISSLTGSQAFLTRANINFNPQSKELSSPSHYFSPSVSVRASDVARLLGARSVRASVHVRKVRHTIPNILVGNRTRPDTILFAHYDSIETGATDNASGVATLMAIAVDHRDMLERNLLVFSACEELSFEQPIYWGYGFRAFEKAHKKLMDEANHLLIVDCVGNDVPHASSDPDLLEDGFPVRNFKKYKRKMKAVYGSIDKLMAVYHSRTDSINRLSCAHMDQSVAFVCRLIAKYQRK